MEIDDFVRCENPGNTYWGQTGKIVRVDNYGAPGIVSVNMEHDAREGPSIRQFSENELEPTERPKGWNDDPRIY